MTSDLDARIRARLDDPKQYLENGVDQRIDALIAALDFHKPTWQTYEFTSGGRWVCSCSADSGWRVLTAEYPCREVRFIAAALGIEVKA